MNKDNKGLGNLDQNETKSMLNLNQVFSDLEDLIRKGLFKKVKNQLEQIVTDKLTTSEMFKCADLYWRISQPMQSLKLMGKRFRNTLPGAPKITEEEKIQYAMALTNLGFHLEAIDILKTVSTNAYPDTHLKIAMCYFGIWDYQKSLPHLYDFLQSEKISEYQRAIGKVNLLAALVALQKGKKSEILGEEIFHTTEKNEFFLLHGNVCEILAQHYFFKKQINEANNYLNRAEFFLKSSPGIYLLYVKKWKAIIQLTTDPNSQELRNEFNRLRAEALEQRAWEVVRDLDLYYAQAIQNPQMGHAVMNASPQPFFKKRALHLFEDHNLIKTKDQSIFHSELSVQLFPKIQVPYDSLNGESFAIKKSLALKELNSAREAQTVQKLFEILSRDGYRPVSLGELFSQLYTGQYFDPYTSEKRVHNAIYRLRLRFRLLNWPLDVVRAGLDFFLSPRTNGIAFTPRAQRPLPYESLKEFHNEFQHRCFSAKALGGFFRLTKKETLDLVQRLLKHKRIIKVGRGSNTQYRFYNGRTRPPSQSAA